MHVGEKQAVTFGSGEGPPRGSQVGGDDPDRGARHDASERM